MKHWTTLRTTSLLSALLFLSHWSDEVARRVESGGFSGLGGVLILVVWLCGPLALGDRRSGHIIMLLGGIVGIGVLVLHMSGPGIAGGRIASSGEVRVYLWVWTLLALGVTSTLSAILSVRGLLDLRSGQLLSPQS